MQTRILRLAQMFCLAALVVLLGQLSSAESRGNFFGAYQFFGVTHSGNNVQLTIQMTLRNYSGQDVKGSGVVLYNSAPVPSPLGAFNEIKSLPSPGKVIITQQFTVPEAEYARWAQGRQPNMKMLLPDGNGGSYTERIDLTPGPSPAAVQ
jgi:hypothetical protein